MRVYAHPKNTFFTIPCPPTRRAKKYTVHTTRMTLTAALPDRTINCLVKRYGRNAAVLTREAVAKYEERRRNIGTSSKSEPFSIILLYVSYGLVTMPKKDRQNKTIPVRSASIIIKNGC